MTEEHRKRLESVIALARAQEKDESDKPDLRDNFITPPSKIQSAISEAGGDLDRVVAWFDSEQQPIYRFVVHGDKVVDAWHKLRAMHASTGYWPIIFGPNESIDRLNNLRGMDRSVTTILSLSQDIDLKAWQADTWAQRKKDRRRPSGKTWPDESKTERPTEFSTPLSSLFYKPLKQIWIGLLPVKHSWESAAVMGFGDWNDVPKSEIHVALHRQWERDFGAELACMKHDTMEFHVSRPPITRDAAMELAELQFDYCPDTVDQGAKSIKALAMYLLNCNIWYFWWD